MAEALTGVVVVEVGGGVAASYCTRLLADLGATVIKVEEPGGDPVRCHEPFPGGTPHREGSGLFL
jgi:crotonobetainyl-CoA:carnitine CoA-transferase CaiB-like acyl-CoA transferase